MVDAQVASFLQGLRGAQGVVVLLYLATQRSLYLADIESACGISNDSAAAAVRGLMSKGMLVKTLGEHGKALYSPVSETFDRLLSGASLFLPGQNPVFPDSGSAVDVVVIGALDSLQVKQQQQQTAGGQNPVFPDSGKEKPGRVLWSITTHKTDDEVSACRAALAECGIYGRKAEQCACYDWTNPEYIRGTVAAVMAQGGEFKNPLGMAIYRMENNLPVQPVRENGHLQVCECADCRAVDKEKAWHEVIQQQLAYSTGRDNWSLNNESEDE